MHNIIRIPEKVKLNRSNKNEIIQTQSEINQISLFNAILPFLTPPLVILAGRSMSLPFLFLLLLPFLAPSRFSCNILDVCWYLIFDLWTPALEQITSQADSCQFLARIDALPKLKYIPYHTIVVDDTVDVSGGTVVEDYGSDKLCITLKVLWDYSLLWIDHSIEWECTGWFLKTFNSYYL